MKRKIDWNKEELEYLLFDNKLTYKEIANHYGITSESAVHKAIKRFGIDISERKTIISKEDIEILLFDKKLTISEISKLYNLTEGATRLRIKRLGIEYEKKNISLVDRNISKEDIENLIKKHLTYKEIGNIYKVSANTIQNLVKLYKINRPKRGNEFIVERIDSFEYVDNVITNESIDNKFLPVPIELSENYKIVLTIKEGNKLVKLFYVPELGIWYNNFSKLKHSIENRLGINFLEWECRWILKLPISKLYTEYWIDKKIEYYYSDKYFHTTEYIKNRLREDPNYVCDFLMIKSDLIEQFNLSREYSEYKYEYDFTNTCEFIKNKTSKFSVFVNEINPFTGDTIGNWETNFLYFIVEKKDNFILGAYKRAIKHKKTDSQFLVEARKVHGDRYTYLDDYINYVTPITILDNCTGDVFKMSPVDHIHRKMGNPIINKSTGELLIITWLKNFQISYLDEVVVNNIRKDKTKSVRIDFSIVVNNQTYWIEYHGEQHYNKFKNFYNWVEDDFIKQFQRDTDVRDYCKNSNGDIILLEVPYILNTYEKVSDFLNKTIKYGIDPNTLIDYKSLYKI